MNGFGWTWHEWVLIWFLIGGMFGGFGCTHAALNANWTAGEHYRWVEPGDDVPWPGYLCKPEFVEWALSNEEGQK